MQPLAESTPVAAGGVSGGGFGGGGGFGETGETGETPPPPPPFTTDDNTPLAWVATRRGGHPVTTPMTMGFGGVSSFATPEVGIAQVELGRPIGAWTRRRFQRVEGSNEKDLFFTFAAFHIQLSVATQRDRGSSRLGAAAAVPAA